MRTLLVEDDLMLGEATVMALVQESFAVDWVRSCSDTLHALLCQNYDVILLDLGLPDGDGNELLPSIRKHSGLTPVIILTARERVYDKVKSLDLGADDYLVKPVDIHELLARIRAVARRGTFKETGTLLSCCGLQLDLSNLTGKYHQRCVDLGPKEFRILQKLIENKGKVVSRQALENTLYSWGHEVESNAIEVHIHRIRKKTNSDLIKTVRSAGYVMETTD